MRSLLSTALAALVLTGLVSAEERPKQAPKIILHSPDGKNVYDLSKLVAEGPVLVRLTCACSGCDQELPYFQKLQSAYNTQGFKTLAVFKETPEAADSYAIKKGLRFLWAADPKGALWKTFDAKTMPTNILIAKGGRVVKVLPGCTRNGKNAQLLSTEVARLLHTKEVHITSAKQPRNK